MRGRGGTGVNAAAAAISRGLVAGIAGTAAMTASQAVEMRLTGREGSTVPGKVGAAVLGLSPDAAQEERLSQVVHWLHGMTGGVMRGAIGLTGLRGPGAGALHFGALWGTDVTLYAALGIAPAPWRWKPDELATDVFHKGVYAVVTAVVYDRLAPAR